MNEENEKDKMVKTADEAATTGKDELPADDVSKGKDESEAKECDLKKESEKPDKAGPAGEKKPPENDELKKLKAETDALRLENETLKAQAATLKNDTARAYADTENTRKRLQKEFDQINKYRIQDFAKEMLPVLDNCERALALKPEDTQDENYRKAFEMVWKQLRSTLEKEGVTEIESLNKPFDPNCHQAMMTEHVEGVEPGTVIQVLQKGYRLKDRLLRAAMVKVSE